jgi:hypothetical protein
MEHQLWKAIVALLAAFGKPRFDPREDFTDHDIVRVWYWAVIHDRPTRWALCPAHWPPHLRRGLRLPSGGTLSKRLRRATVVALLDALAQRVIAPKEPGLFWIIDGKPLPIGGCSKDRQAGYGRAAGGKAKGYKLHVLAGSDGVIADWRVAPMNKDERVLALRLVRCAPPEVLGYVAADANYDSNELHRACDERGDLQLVTPRRYGPGKGTGHRTQAAGRLRSIALTEAPRPDFGAQLLQDRTEVERQFGNLVNWGGGLSGLPAWVRGHRRVHRWVQAKLVLSALKGQLRQTTCAA